MLDVQEGVRRHSPRLRQGVERAAKVLRTAAHEVSKQMAGEMRRVAREVERADDPYSLLLGYEQDYAMDRRPRSHIALKAVSKALAEVS